MFSAFNDVERIEFEGIKETENSASYLFYLTPSILRLFCKVENKFKKIPKLDSNSEINYLYFYYLVNSLFLFSLVLNFFFNLNFEKF